MTKNKMKFAAITAAMLSAAGLAALLIKGVHCFGKGGARNA
jgi:hypothetical protein